MTEHIVHAIQRTGSAHRVCQDRYMVVRHGDRLVLAACDGHGGKPYVRSGLGARLACAAVKNVLTQPTLPPDIPAAIKDCYDAMVARHRAFRPLEDWELERLGSRDPAEAYGTTLLAALITPESTVLLQMGDGDLHALRTNGTFFPALPADENCQGNLTSSMANSRDCVLSHFRCARFEEPAAAVMMFTDGCDGGLLQTAGAALDLEGAEGLLRQMFRDTSRGDDQTVILACAPGSGNDEVFRTNLDKSLSRMRYDIRRRRQEARDREEFARLDNYLRLALKKAGRMLRRGDPEFEAYMDKLKPDFLRMKELQKRMRPLSDR